MLLICINAGLALPSGMIKSECSRSKFSKLSKVVIAHEGQCTCRDIKPANTLFMLTSQVWRLIDYGIAAHNGALPLWLPLWLRSAPVLV